MFILKTVGDALTHIGRCQAMPDEISALQNSETWKLIPLPSGKPVVGYRWIFFVKVGPNDTIDRLKAHLVTKVIHKFLI